LHEEIAVSKDNIVELCGKKGIAANPSDGGIPPAMNECASLDAGRQNAPDAAAELDEEIIDALRVARKGLTDGGIGAVIALRRRSRSIPRLSSYSSRVSSMLV
jgi:hypothetical protein